MDIISFYRVERWLFERHIPVLPKIVQLLIFLIFNSKITADSKIGKGSYCVCKGISTVLIPGTEIGENCVLGLRFSTVRQFPYKEVPCLKNNVWVGPNVIIAGPVVIEDDVVIAGNSFVNRSVPKGAIVAGCPARVIKYRFNDEIINKLKKINYQNLSDDFIKQHINDFYKDIKKESDLPDWI